MSSQLTVLPRRARRGARAERIVAHHVAGLGMTVLERNLRVGYLEIDIVARYQDFLVFVEVRTKRSLKFGSPEESITPTKKERLRTAAARYRQAHSDLPPLWRIEFVGVVLNQ